MGLKLLGDNRDEQAVKDGALVNFGSNPDGTLKVGRVKPLNNTHYEDRLAALRRRHPRAGERDPNIERADQIHAMAEKVFIELVQGDTAIGKSAWLDADGNAIADTVQNRIAILEDRDWFQDVALAASARETFRREQFEDDSGNSPRSSTGD